MIDIEKIKGLIQDKLSEKDCFVVALDVQQDNNIYLEIDSFEGVTINDCIAFSRQIEHNLDREEEDFELHVSSPGLDKPLRVREQYLKNQGKQVKVVLLTGEVVKGTLKEVKEEEIIIEYSYKERIEGRKKKQLITKEDCIAFSAIKETTIIISFK